MKINCCRLEGKTRLFVLFILLKMEENKPKRFFGYTVMQLCCCLIGCYAYLAYGCIDSSKSVYFPLIQEYYHLEYNYQGLLVGISSIGYLAFSLFVGYLSIRVGIKWTLSLGFFILTIAFWLLDCSYRTCRRVSHYCWNWNRLPRCEHQHLVNSSLHIAQGSDDEYSSLLLWFWSLNRTHHQ